MVDLCKMQPNEAEFVNRIKHEKRIQPSQACIGYLQNLRRKINREIKQTIWTS